jgi:hypothetical protein
LDSQCIAHVELIERQQIKQQGLVPIQPFQQLQHQREFVHRHTNLEPLFCDEWPPRNVKQRATTTSGYDNATKQREPADDT